MAHTIDKCECGRIIRQCRCMAPDKQMNIISPCIHKQIKNLENFLSNTLQNALNDGLSLTYRNERTGEIKAIRVILAALTDENYVVLKLPKGIQVEHGARLVDRRRGSERLYAIEATPTNHSFEESEYMPGGCAICGDRIAPADHKVSP